MQLGLAVRAGRPAWVNARTLLGGLLFVSALVAGTRVMAAADVRVTVWAATSDLGRGSVIAPGDLEPIKVNLPGPQLSNYVSSGSDLVGAILARPLAQGELVPAGAIVTDAGAALGRSVSVPVGSDHRAPAGLAPGDRVDVFATFGEGDGARTLLVAPAVEVQDVTTEPGLMGESVATSIVLSVSPETAHEVVLALRAGRVDLLRIEGGGALPVGSAATVRDLR